MLGPISVRMYVVIALITSAVLYLIQRVDNAEWLSKFIFDMGLIADRVLPTTLVQAITVPLRWGVTEPLGALMIGIFWPIGALWLLVFLLMITYGYIGPALGAVQDTYEAG